MSGRRRTSRAETNAVEWEQLKLLAPWPEQVRYELIRPIVLFDLSPAQRARETGEASERTLYRKAARFEAEGMESLFDAPAAKRQKLPPSLRRLIVDLKAEHPALSLGEVANVCYVRSGRRPSKSTVKRVLEEEPTPLRILRRFDHYHEIGDPKERRAAVVALHSEGWAPRSIAGYLRAHRSTVYRILRRWVKEGVEGLDDRQHGRPAGVRKVDLKAIEAVRRLQENPGLGAFRVHAALAQIGIHLSPATCGRILALNRRLYGLEKPRGPSREPREMPFASSRRHEYWTADIRYVNDHRLGGRAYVVSVLENHSRAILSSGVFRTQDLSAFLSVLYRAVEAYGSPEALVTDGGSIFRANRAKAVYGALKIRKEQIERRQPWQSYIETAFNVQRRMADWHFARAENWAELVVTHDRFVEDYNAQPHFAHVGRPDGRRSPSEVLGWVPGVRYRPEELERAFFAARFSRVLDPLGYVRFRDWRIYGKEGLAKQEAAIWLHEKTLTLEHAGQPLSRYDVEYAPGDPGEADGKKLAAIRRPRLFETSFALAQLKLFGLDALGESGWLKAIKLEDYAPRRPHRPQALQDVLFPYLDAL